MALYRPLKMAIALATAVAGFAMSTTSAHAVPIFNTSKSWEIDATVNAQQIKVNSVTGDVYNITYELALNIIAMPTNTILNSIGVDYQIFNIQTMTGSYTVTASNNNTGDVYYAGAPRDVVLGDPDVFDDITPDPVFIDNLIGLTPSPTLPDVAAIVSNFGIGFVDVTSSDIGNIFSVTVLSSYLLTSDLPSEFLATSLPTGGIYDDLVTRNGSGAYEFTIAGRNLTAEELPAPTPLALIGVALLGYGVLRRRRPC